MPAVPTRPALPHSAGSPTHLSCPPDDCPLLLLSLPYQVAHGEHVVKVLGHGVVLHGHEEGVEHDADGDAQVHKGVHNDQEDNVLELHPRGTAVPDEHFVRTLVPPWGALLMGLFQLWRRGRYNRLSDEESLPGSTLSLSSSLLLFGTPLSTPATDRPALTSSL